MVAVLSNQSQEISVVRNEDPTLPHNVRHLLIIGGRTETSLNRCRYINAVASQCTSDGQIDMLVKVKTHTRRHRNSCQLMP